MTYYLPSSGNTWNGDVPVNLVPSAAPASEISDLKIFWGPDICRLEYLIHLVDTGRIKDERSRPGPARF